jgi:hypothetical protein
MTEHLNQLNVKMYGVGNTNLSLQQAVFAIENRLELFIADTETCYLLHLNKLVALKYTCTLSQHPYIQQLAYVASNLLQSFQTSVRELLEHTRLFKIITHPH